MMPSQFKNNDLANAVAVQADGKIEKGRKRGRI
jgi:hypothetical protein